MALTFGGQSWPAGYIGVLNYSHDSAAAQTTHMDIVTVYLAGNEEGATLAEVRGTGAEETFLSELDFANWRSYVYSRIKLTRRKDLAGVVTSDYSLDVRETFYENPSGVGCATCGMMIFGPGSMTAELVSESKLWSPASVFGAVCGVASLVGTALACCFPTAASLPRQFFLRARKMRFVLEPRNLASVGDSEMVGLGKV